jgi:hypothetical protein
MYLIRPHYQPDVERCLGLPLRVPPHTVGVWPPTTTESCLYNCGDVGFMLTVRTVGATRADASARERGLERMQVEVGSVREVVNLMVAQKAEVAVAHAAEVQYYQAHLRAVKQVSMSQQTLMEVRRAPPPYAFSYMPAICAQWWWWANLSWSLLRHPRKAPE